MNRVSSRRLPDVAVSLALALGLVLTMAPPASAHVVREEHWTHWSQDTCQRTGSEINHGSGGGQVRGESKAWRTLRVPGFGSYPCAEYYIRPPGGHTAKVDTFVYVNGQWVLCTATAWHYNNQSTWSYAIQSSHGSQPPCGAAWYGTNAHTFHNNNNQWYGGTVWSGHHWLPS